MAKEDGVLKYMARLGALFGLVLGLLFQGAPAQASHRLLHLHWARTSNPFTLTYSANVGSTWTNLVSKVIGEWDNVTQYKAGTFDVVNYTQGATPKLTIESKNYGATGWFGQASVSFD